MHFNIRMNSATQCSGVKFMYRLQSSSVVQSWVSAVGNWSVLIGPAGEPIITKSIIEFVPLIVGLLKQLNRF